MSDHPTDDRLAALLAEHPPAEQVAAAERGEPMLVYEGVNRTMPVVVLGPQLGGHWPCGWLREGRGWSVGGLGSDHLRFPEPEPVRHPITVEWDEYQIRRVAEMWTEDAGECGSDVGDACRAWVADRDDPGDQDSGLSLADVQVATDALTSHRASATTAVPDPPEVREADRDEWDRARRSEAERLAAMGGEGHDTDPSTPPAVPDPPEVREVVQALNLVPAGGAIPLAAFDAVEALAERGWIDTAAVGAALRAADEEATDGDA